MDNDFIYLFLILNMVVAIYYYLKTTCEIPIFLTLFNVLVHYRIITLELGLSNFVDFNYGIDFTFNLDMAYLISWYILIGTSVLMYVFMFVYKPVVKYFTDTDVYLKDFLELNKKYIIAGLVVFTVFQLFLSSNISDGYGNLSKLANSSFILLLFLLFYFTEKTNIQLKVIYLIAFLFIGYVTYSPSLRFQFLGWMIPMAYFMLYKIKPTIKLWLMAVGVFGILILFSIAGMMRYNELSEMSAEEIYDESYERIQVSDDVNFIDGFMMMYQIYPQYLDHTYGIEHLNILLRPIPRTIWEGKPLAGWFQNYQEKYNTQQLNVGFSPTLYGVFYAELGVEGIVMFSVIWAYALSWVYRSLCIYKSKLSYLLIGILLTTLIPIFRSGDLAGDFAIVLMSYWPIIFFVYKYKKYARKRYYVDNVQAVKA
jgi:hypothetical protein